MATLTFDGIGFEANSEPLDVEGDSLLSDRPIPGGNITYRDSGGVLPRHWTYSVYCADDATFALLMGKRNVTGTLVTTVDGTVTATLKAVRRTRRNWDGQTDATAEFWEG